MIEPLFYVDDIHDFRANRIFQDGILNVLVHCQIHQYLPILLFPFGNDIQPELNETQRSCKLFAYGVDDIGLSLEGIQ